MNYRETLQYLYDALPMFHRQGKTAYKKDLTNIRALCEALDNPQQKLKCIHIAGTNGKGSVSHMMAAILQAHGYKTGLYVSPHYKDFRERIKINGRYISRSYITHFVEKNMDLFNKVAPSFFEMTVAMAFSYFKKQKVDFAVIETGLGGRLDSTNIIQPLLSIITNISWDHSDLLGDSLEKIAQEKAGIIKADTPVVIGRKQIESAPVFNHMAKAQHAPIYYAQDHTTIHSVEGPKGLDRISFEIDGIEMVVKPSLNGIYQLENINTVLSACQVLNAFKIVQLESSKIAIGIEKTSELTC
ncbi:MAG: Mur ligase family protein, partial [Saprospiraceae bacterium]